MDPILTRRMAVAALSALTLATAPLALAQSDSAASEAHDHDHDHDHDHHDHEHDHAKDIYAGYFDDDQIKDRPLSDWEGDWQSVYPYLLDGTLDEVFAHKAQQSDDKSAEEYKAYYEIGYETDVDRIVIDGSAVSFHEDGQVLSGEYASDGYEVLTYKAGNRGVRYIFEYQGEDDSLPNYIQFSDHAIYPTEADHYHLYWGDDRAALLEEVTNWPTYYPTHLDGQGVVDEMLAH